jgi:outer membrane protein assembly factor BamD (BamD/ComL family)
MKYQVLILGLLIIFSSCNNTEVKDDKSSTIEKIVELEKQAFNDENLSYNHKVALQTLKEYQAFIEKYPKDSMTCNYLYMSAQLSKSINLFGEAVRKYKTFADTYKDDDRAPKAAFMVGMIYETDLKDTLKAKEAYQEFIEKYPNNELVDDAQFLIQNLSLTDDELIEMLEAKSKGDSAAI